MGEDGGEAPDFTQMFGNDEDGEEEGEGKKESKLGGSPKSKEKPEEPEKNQVKKSFVAVIDKSGIPVRIRNNNSRRYPKYLVDVEI